MSFKCWLISILFICSPIPVMAQTSADNESGAAHAQHSAVAPEILKALQEGPKGSIAIRAVQGTKDAPAVGAAEVELELYHRNQRVALIKAKLDDNGLVVVRDVPVALSVTPVARIKYADVTYQDVGPQLDSSHASDSMDVTVYQVTDEKPTWKVIQRTLAIATVPGELDVVEAVEVENPTDKTWIGDPPDDRKRRATVRLDLPPGASNINLAYGFHGWCCTTFKDDVLIVEMPLMPGKSPFRFSYRLPAPTGSVDVRFSTPAFCDRVALLLPDNLEGVIPSGLSKGETKMISSTLVRIYSAVGVVPDKPLGVSLSGLEPAAPQTAAQTPDPSAPQTSAQQPKSGGADTSSTPVAARPTSSAPPKPSSFDGSMPVIIALGVGVLILVGAVVLYVRAPGERKKSTF